MISSLLFFLLAQAINPLTPQESIEKLKKGNERYAHDDFLNPRRDSMRREATAARQEPFAVVLTCSDSRVPPEIIFDQGVGDIFVVRVAGNVAGPLEIDSVEYAVKYLKASVIYVMGHENCGAIKAVLSGNTKDIEAVASLIEPALRDVKNDDGDPLENAIKANVRRVVEQLRESALIAEYIDNGRVKVVGGYYNLTSGLITSID